MSSETSTETRSDANDSSEQDLKARFELFQTRAKAEWQLAESKARAEIVALPAKLKSGATLAFDRLRNGLDLPSRGEVAALAARIEELATKLAEYESQRAPKSSKKNEAKD
jgi:hypothetical protein